MFNSCKQRVAAKTPQTWCPRIPVLITLGRYRAWFFHLYKTHQNQLYYFFHTLNKVVTKKAQKFEDSPETVHCRLPQDNQRVIWTETVRLWVRNAIGLHVAWLLQVEWKNIIPETIINGVVHKSALVGTQHRSSGIIIWSFWCRIFFNGSLTSSKKETPHQRLGTPQNKVMITIVV